MNLYFIGHNCKYAAEQILFSLYPHERATYPEGKRVGDGAVISYKNGEKFATATCSIYVENKVFRGKSTVSNDILYADDLSEQRNMQRCIKLAFYRASLRHLGKKPPWGAITGIRPASLMEKILREGFSEKRAVTEFLRLFDTEKEKAELSLSAALAGIEIKKTLKPEDICLYVGIPFCPTRCSYCSFVSQSVEKMSHLIEPFLEALHKELEATAKILKELDLNIISIYMGGGTPTTLSPAQLDTLCSTLYRNFDLSNVREFTVEAGRPDTITVEKMEVLAKHKVTRVSVNPQTMDDELLQSIGRNHTAQDIIDAVKIVRKCGNFEINMDLITGLIGDTPERFEKSLDRVLALNPENITVHTLAMKKGSRLIENGREHETGDTTRQMLETAESKLSSQNYAPYYLYRQKFTSGGYENVGFCKKDYENLYNVCIMEELTSIIATGGGASTKLVFPRGKIHRMYCPKYPLEYINGIDKVISDKNKIKELFENAIPTE